MGQVRFARTTEPVAPPQSNGCAPGRVLLARGTMDRLLARLERRVGRYAIPNLMIYIVGGMALVWVLQQFGHVDVVPRITLDLHAVLHGRSGASSRSSSSPSTARPGGCCSTSTSPGGWARASSSTGARSSSTPSTSWASSARSSRPSSPGPQTNFWLDASLFLAFATTFPEVQILLFFILPIRVKWLGIVAGLGIGAALLLGDWTTRAAIVGATGNYLLFFGGHWLAGLAVEKPPGPPEGAPHPVRRRDRPSSGSACARSAAHARPTAADIRVCSCEKCGGQQRALCLEHARNH